MSDEAAELELLREENDELRATAEILRLNNELLSVEVKQLSLLLNEFASDELKRRSHDCE